MPDATPATPPQGNDWPAEAADRIVKLVEQVRDKTTGPLETAARGVVYGLLAGLLGAMAGIVLAIAMVRGLDEITQGIWGTHETYLAYAVTALVFTLVGMVLWSKRRAPSET